MLNLFKRRPASMGDDYTVEEIAKIAASQRKKSYQALTSKDFLSYKQSADIWDRILAARKRSG